MADPKPLRIFTDLAGRLSVIEKSAGYFTDIGARVEKGNYVFNAENVPAVAVFLQRGAVASTGGNGITTDCGITVRASIVYNRDPDVEALYMLADIHRALEIPVDWRPGPSDYHGRVVETDWRIVYPDDASSIISAEADFSFSYSRNYGED